MKYTYFAWIHYSWQTIQNINNSFVIKPTFYRQKPSHFWHIHICNNCFYLYSLLTQISIFCNLTFDNTGIKKQSIDKGSWKIVCWTLKFNACRQTNLEVSFGNFILITSLSVRLQETLCYCNLRTNHYNSSYRRSEVKRLEAPWFIEIVISFF